MRHEDPLGIHAPAEAIRQGTVQGRLESKSSGRKVEAISYASFRGFQRSQKIGDRLDQQPIGQRRGVHQKPEIAAITGQQYVRFASVGSSVERPVFLGKISWAWDGGIVRHQPDRTQLLSELRQRSGALRSRFRRASSLAQALVAS